MGNNFSELIIFDFCETLVSKQTANNFINYISKRRSTFWIVVISFGEMVLTYTRFFAVFDVFFSNFNLSKRINLLKIKGISESEIKNYAKLYYTDFIMPNFNSRILNILVNENNSKDKVIVVVSGGYNDYLQIFCANFNVQFLISTQIEFKNGKATGFFKGLDCMFDEKVNKISDLLKEKKWSFISKTLYSDSISDLPLFNWVDHKFVISYNKSQLWPEKYGFNEIILKQND